MFYLDYDQVEEPVSQENKKRNGGSGACGVHAGRFSRPSLGEQKNIN